MEYSQLICNFKECYKELKDTAYVTFCSHIFCVDHGQKLKLNLSNGCPACKKVLSEHQIMEAKLDLAIDAMKLLLSGHNPRTILEVANSALSFWNYQKKHEYLDMKRTMEHYRLKLQNQTKTADVVAKEKDVRIYSLMKENEKLFNESRILKAELSSKTEEMIQSKRAKKDYLFEVQ